MITLRIFGKCFLAVLLGMTDVFNTYINSEDKEMYIVQNVFEGT